MDKLIVINKPTGYTSRDIVNIISKKFNTKKVGHTGTLDPLAEGVLVVAINKATKLVEYLTDHEKDYIATVKLGILTDTYDITGKVLKEASVNVDKEELINTLNTFNKEYLQEVPIYSAVKVNGKKLYEYARENKEVELPKRLVNISNIKLLDYQGDTFTFKVHVSKGTYIRALIKDICDSLGTIGTMEKLVRTKLGNFDINDANSLEGLENDCYQLISISEALSDVKHIEVSDELLFKIANGVVYEDSGNDQYILFTHNQEAVALYQKNCDNKYHMDKYFA